MKKRVPVVAMWLLERFGVKRQNDALIGDLVEEYQAGRSAAWFWRQTAVAITRAMARDVRENRLLALRAIALGWIFQWIWQWICVFLFFHYVFPRPFTLPRPPFASLLFDMAIFSQYILIGWLIARTHRAQAGGMVLAYVASQIPLRVWGLGQVYSQMYNPHIFPWHVLHRSGNMIAVHTSVPVWIGPGGLHSLSIVAFGLATLESMLVGFLCTIAGALLVPPKTLPPSSASLEDGVSSAC